VRRREALLAVAAAALARVPTARAQDPDLDITRRLLARERAAARAYAQAAGPAWTARFAAQDSRHARVLATHVEAFGAQAPAPRRPPLDPLAAHVAAAGPDRRALLHAALALEADLIAIYENALKMLNEPNTATTVGRVLASHVQQLVLLRRRAGRDPLAPV
jgi:hypothetical protein